MEIIRNRKKISHPEWSYKTNIYEVNLRQYTKDGTFKAFSRELPRLADMGVGVLWFMPVTPISDEGRLGTLGSYYAVKNYKEVNPEFGTLDDFKDLVSAAQKMGFRVIVDFVGNHTGNDHHWIKEHPGFYQFDENGNVLHPHGWWDVAQLNFEERGVWDALIDAMAFWITECNIDGFRCDMAHLVPLELWYEARQKLEVIKPGQFWLAECEVPAYHQVFDATYTWRWMHASEDFYHGRTGLDGLLKELYRSDVEFGCDSFRVYFTSNHDENSWNGTEYEKYGNAAHLLAVFSITWKGIPMIYSGQELPNLKRLKFFDKDPIEWKDQYELHDFYKTLLHLKSGNPALRAGDNSHTTILSSSDDSRIFAFLRSHEDGEVLTILNLSGRNQSFKPFVVKGNFRNIFSGEEIMLDGGSNLDIMSWGYLVFERIEK